MKKYRLTLTLAAGAAAVAIWLASCSTISRLFVEKPKVTFDHVGVKDVSASGATILFGILVDNPNSFALKVDSVKYEADLDGRHVSGGVIKDLPEVPAKQKAVVEIPIAVQFADLFSSLLGFVQNKSSTYHVTGEASFGMLTVPFDQSGEVKLHD